MEKVWLKSYPGSVPADILPLKENSLAEMMEKRLSPLR